MDLVDYYLHLMPILHILLGGVPSNFSSMGIRQGCPLSPYLFICYANILSHVLWVAMGNYGLDPYLSALGALPIFHLLFVDGCLLMG